VESELVPLAFFFAGDHGFGGCAAGFFLESYFLPSEGRTIWIVDAHRDDLSLRERMKS
jgi:hypothetical protein